MRGRMVLIRAFAYYIASQLNIIGFSPTSFGVFKQRRSPTALTKCLSYVRRDMIRRQVVSVL